MKNLNTRTKALLAIAGLVIVVVVVGLVIFEPGEQGLVGTTVIHISPENPTITTGQTVNLSINSVFDCTWTMPNHDFAYIDGGGSMVYYRVGKSVSVIGFIPGQVVITAKCPFHTRSTTVTVR